MKLKITKNAAGRSVASFDCPRCGLALESELSESGGHGFCPDCNFKFKLPGTGAKGIGMGAKGSTAKGDEALQALQQVVKTIDPPKQSKAPKKDPAPRSGSKSASINKPLRPKQQDKFQDSRPPAGDHTFDSLPAPEPQTKDCPYCGEKINAKATKCRFCRESLEDGGAGPSVADATPANLPPRIQDTDPPNLPPPIRQQYYIVKAGKRFGPLVKSQLLQLALKHEINILTLAWRPGMSTWMKIVDISELEPLFSSIPPPLPNDDRD